jgi:hypothetical protein
MLYWVGECFSTSAGAGTTLIHPMFSIDPTPAFAGPTYDDYQAVLSITEVTFRGALVEARARGVIVDPRCLPRGAVVA